MEGKTITAFNTKFLTRIPKKRCEKSNLGVQLLQTQLTLTPFIYLQVTYF